MLLFIGRKRAKRLKRVIFGQLPQKPLEISSFQSAAVIEVVVSPSLVISYLIMKPLLLSLVVRDKIQPTTHVKSRIHKKPPYNFVRNRHNNVR